jgi:hypothetical protein
MHLVHGFHSKVLIERSRAGRRHPARRTLAQRRLKVWRVLRAHKRRHHARCTKRAVKSNKSETILTDSLPKLSQPLSPPGKPGPGRQYSQKGGVIAGLDLLHSGAGTDGTAHCGTAHSYVHPHTGIVELGGTPGPETGSR